MPESLLMSASIFKQKITGSTVDTDPYKDLGSTTIQGQLGELEDEKADVSHNQDISTITNHGNPLTSAVIDANILLQATVFGALL